MNIGSSVDDLGLVILLLVPALLGPALLLGLGALLGRALRLSPSLFALIFTLAVLGGGGVAGSLYLDVGGRPLNGLVTSKVEQVELRRQGDWRHTTRVEVQYPAGPASGAASAAATLNLAPAAFDGLREGEPVRLRVLPLWRSLGLVALADSSTATRLPWGWLAGGLGAIGLGWLLVRRWGGYGVFALVIVTLLALAGGPLAGAYGDWRSLARPDSRPLQAQATVRELEEVTTIDPLPCRPGSGSRCSRGPNTSFRVPQPYTVVQLSFVPAGGREAVVAVASADAGSLNLRPGDTVTLDYAAGNPRDARLPGAGHRHRWLNPLAAVGVVAAPFGVIVLLLVGIIALSRRRRAPARSRQGS